MKLSYSFLVSALGCISTLASPVEKRQDVDLNAAFQNVPTPNVTSTSLPAVLPDYLIQKLGFDPSQLANALANATNATNVKRADCIYSAGLTFSDVDGKVLNTAVERTSFVQGSKYRDIASSAATPAGSDVVYTAMTAASSFDGPNWIALDTYDVQACRSYCENNVPGCQAYNIYYFGLFVESPGCEYESKVKIYCDALTFVPDNNPSTGDYDFPWYTVYARTVGSNAYQLETVPTLSGFQTGHSLGTCVVNAPLDSDNNNINTYMGLKTFSNPDYTQCAKACTDQTAYNAKHPKADGTYNTCNYVTAALVYSGDTLQGLACSLYTKDWSSIEYSKPECGNRGKTYKAAASYLISGYSPASRTELKKSP